jgi:hypothetical protein
MYLASSAPVENERLSFDTANALSALRNTVAPHNRGGADARSNARAGSFRGHLVAAASRQHDRPYRRRVIDLHVADWGLTGPHHYFLGRVGDVAP